MAQTKRRRRSKHRGTAAGTIEARGRTGRRPAAGEKASKSASTSRARRYDRPPTWQGAFARAAIASALFFGLVTLLFEQPLASAAVITLFTLAIYTPFGYYTDLFLYRRRQRAKGGTRGAGR